MLLTLVMSLFFSQKFKAQTWNFGPLREIGTAGTICLHQPSWAWTALPHGGPTCQTGKCNCTRRLLSRGHRPDDKEPREEVYSWISLPKGKQAKEYKMSAKGMLPLIEWRRAPTGWKPRINNNNNNEKISKACQLGRDIWLVIRGACESINPSLSWINTLKHASLHCCRRTCWMSCKDEWN